MIRDGVLLAPLLPALLLDPSPLLPILFDALTERTSRSFTTIFVSTSKFTDLYDVLRSNSAANWSTFQAFLAKIYSILAAAQWRAGRVLMDVDVHFADRSGTIQLPRTLESEGYDIFLLEGFEELRLDPAVSSTVVGSQCQTVIPSPIVQQGVSGAKMGFEELSRQPPTVAAVGGTFDHLHAGHKLLLQLSLFACTRKLIVGVMSDSLLSSKSHAELVEPLATRVSAVEAFLLRHGARRKGGEGSGVEMNVLEIHDAYGPTAWDEDIDALVISKETTSGGDAVNRVRREKGLKELAIFSADVISSTLVEDEISLASSVRTRDLTGDLDEAQLKGLKLSSTTIRQWVADHERSSHAP